MKVYAAQHPAASDEDRIFVSDTGVIALDGATSFAASRLSTKEYVETLGTYMRDRLDGHEELTTILYDAIELTTQDLRLSPDNAPSSTVAMIRLRDMHFEVLALGDSSVSIGNQDGSVETLCDNRLNALNFPEASRYRERLASGSGYDSEHLALLRSLQRRQRECRNRPGGYWIAETDPNAARQALMRKYPTKGVSWAVAATDGVTDLLPVMTLSWPDIARCDSAGLADLLAKCHRWEAEYDPDGAICPRAKRHDDKSVAVVIP